MVVVTRMVFGVAAVVFNAGALVSTDVLPATGSSGRALVFARIAAAFSFGVGSATGAGVGFVSLVLAGFELGSVFAGVGCAGESGMMEAILSFSTSTKPKS